MDTDKAWSEAKLRAWQRLWEDLEIGYLDTDILDVLLELFARPYSYPVSSCSGRIVVIDSRMPWERNETNLVFKRHEKISYKDVLEVIERPFSERLWLSVQGPIYHIHARSLEEAFQLLEIARRAGFKHSGILSCREDCVVELRTGVRMATPIADKETGYRVNDEQLRKLVNIANEVLDEAKERNKRLLIELRRNRPSNIWQPALEAMSELEMYRKQLIRA